MKSEIKILIAFILNLGFSIFEFIGGTITNSVAIISDSIHDIGDAVGIGISYILEKLSKKKSNNKYTYGYVRYSVIGSLITTFILLLGSIFIVLSSIKRLISPEIINYNGMILLATVGVIINFLAAYFTHNGHSLNQKAVNLHMLEDVLGWIVVLIGAIVMKLTNVFVLDPILSILVAIYIFINAIKNLIKILDLFLEKTPNNIDIDKLKSTLLKLNNIKSIHHIHVWSIDGYNNYLTMHIVATKYSKELKNQIKEKLIEYNIHHSTIEFEDVAEKCIDTHCKLKYNNHIH